LLNKNYNIIYFLILSLFISVQSTYGIEKSIKITKKYLNIPIQYKVEKSIVYFIVDKDTVKHGKFNLSDGSKIDSWTAVDFTSFMGKKIIISSENEGGLKLICQSNDLKLLGDNLYDEPYRQQLSYSARRSWQGDPNGLIYYKGEYHLFYQHPIFDVYNWYPSWGHAVSKDLIHWKELEPAIAPDRNGVIFSGSCVNDVNNTAGFGDSTIIAFYTNARASTTGLQTPFNLPTPFNSGRGQVQCMAYSNDNGRTFTKYEGNPILIGDIKWGDETRDPQVFWYEPNKEWVMVLFQGQGQTFFTSKNLKDWKEESHTRGIRECPEFFELPVDGDPNNKKWISLGAASTYMIGDFDGKIFTPTHGKYLNAVGSRYASQVFDDEPEGRIVEMAFQLNTYVPDSFPIRLPLIFPVEMSLKTTPEGVRLYRQPIKEIKKLYKDTYKWEGLNGIQANEKMKRINENDRLLHIKAKVEMTMELYANIQFNGIKIFDYDGNSACINYPYPGIYTGRMQYSCTPPGSHKFDLEMVIDRLSAEVYVDGGKLQIVTGITQGNGEDGLVFPDNVTFKVHSLVVNTLESIWKDKSIFK